MRNCVLVSKQSAQLLRRELLGAGRTKYLSWQNGFRVLLLQKSHIIVLTDFPPHSQDGAQGIMASSLELMAALSQTIAQKLILLTPDPNADFLLPRHSRRSTAFPPGPAFDIALRLAHDPLRCLEDLSFQYGSVVGFRLLSSPVVLVSSPFHAKEVFVNQSHIFIKEGTAFFPSSSLTGNGLLVSDGELWKRQRRLSNPAFRKSAVDTYANAMVGRTWEMVETKWSRGGVRDVYADFNSLTMEIVASALFGDSGVEGMDEVGPAITSAFEFFARRGASMQLLPEWLPTPENVRYLASLKRLDEIVYRLVSERRNRLKFNFCGESHETVSHVVPKDLLTRLLEARDKDGSGMDDRSLRDELMTFLVAGQETSAILLTWALVMLALHRPVQNCLYNECMKVLGERLPTHEDASKLRYLEAVIWETMRLMPPAYIVGRCAQQNTKLGSWEVSAGTTIMLSPYLLHRDPAYWPRASEFYPERWLPGGGAVQHSDNDSYWPFGGGPRNCIGTGFAMMEVTLVLATIIRQFKVALPPGSGAPSPKAMITLRPENKVDILLSKRRVRTQRTYRFSPQRLSRAQKT